MARILLVDDQNVVITVLKAALKLLGDEYLVATSATGAIGDADGMDTIDLIIVDHSLPPLGRTVAERVLERHPTCKVLHIFAYPQNSLPPDSITPGAAFLEKPFTIAQVKQAVTATLASAA